MICDPRAKRGTRDILSYSPIAEKKKKKRKSRPFSSHDHDERSSSFEHSEASYRENASRLRLNKPNYQPTHPPPRERTS